MKSTAPAPYPSQVIVFALKAIGYLISKAFWFIQYNGLEHIPDRSFGGFLIAANHQTYIDPVWICIPLRCKLRFMAVDKAFEWRFVGRMIKYLGAFPVSMEAGGTIKAMKEALRSLRDGAALTVFPEGAREFADGNILPFKTGAVRIALQAGVPILPVTVSGGNLIWPQKQKYPRLFKRVVITYHPLMNLTQNGDLESHENLEQLTTDLKSIISTPNPPPDQLGGFGGINTGGR